MTKKLLALTLVICMAVAIWVEGYMFKAFSVTAEATTDDNGSAYLIIGTDSGYEGFTEYYIDDVSVSIK